MFTMNKMNFKHVNTCFEKLLILPYNAVKIISKTSKYFKFKKEN